MNNYIICTDSACDIPSELLAAWGVPCRQLTFRFQEDAQEYTGLTMDIKSFYDKMRAGGIAKTAAVNTEAFSEMFEELLSIGKDVLYLGFSSGLSATYNCARIAADELREKYPDRKILTVDSLAASAGFGLLLYLTLEEQKKGATIEEAAAFAEATKLRICHWFTVDDLEYLRRGGRVSAATKVVGNLLRIKPILHVDNAGHLIKVGLAQGRRKSLEVIADKFGEMADQVPEQATIYISHGDCLADAELVASLIKEKWHGNVQLITHVGSVIGAHSGPGTIALFFVGKER